MEVTKLENVATNKYKVFLDGEFAFVLYKGELSRYGIKEGGVLEVESYNNIKSQIVTKRAKKRVLYLLEKMPRTESQVRTKLQRSHYTPDIIDIAVEYAKKFGYIKDDFYAKSYAQIKMSQKSRKEIYFALLGKGVNKETISNVLDELYIENDESELIRKLIRKKGYDPVSMSRADIQKMNGFLMRKGFSYDEIRNVFERIINDIDTY